MGHQTISTRQFSPLCRVGSGAICCFRSNSGAIDDNGTPQAVLTQLVDEKMRKQALAKLIPQAYGEVLKGIDLSKASPATLDNAIRNTNVHGATHNKARAFLIKAAQFAGLSISGHLAKRTRKSGPRGNGTGQRRPSLKSQTANVETPTTVKEGEEVKIELRTGGSLKLVLSVRFVDLDIDDRKFVFDLIDKMTGYEQEKGTGNKSSEEGSND
jgi:hypothetical protein